LKVWNLIDLENMIGAIIGDIVGSRFEFDNCLHTEFELFTGESTFTDDSICTIAVADAILRQVPFQEALRHWCKLYPHPKGGYGASFAKWLHSDYPKPYNSFGNGSAMRVSPCAWASDDPNVVQDYAQQSAICTHNHPEGVKGATAVALCILHARTGYSKEELKQFMYQHYPVDLSCDGIRENNAFDETCQITVPQAFTCFYESTDFVHALRLAVSIGGDSDTIAAITGSIAHAFYGIPDDVKNHAMALLPTDLIDVIEKFSNRYLH
jgi:ADP-ribosylglycohydrolase